MNVSESKVPFEGFSLERSTSFSKEHDEADAIAAAEEALFQGIPISLQQKYTKQVYSETERFLMKQKGCKPLERKPFVFEQEGKQNVVSDHIEKIKHAAQKNS